MRQFCFAKEIPLRVRKLVFRARLVEAALSGLEAFVLSAGDHNRLDREVLFYARKLLRDKSGQRIYD